MFNGQGGYQPPPAWQQGFNQAPQRTGPPPAKKPRGNPVITRYPPPPGYRGPAQPQVPYQQQAYQQQPAWQPPAQPYSYGPTPYFGYPPQTYGAPQLYQQPSFPGYPAQPQYQYPPPQYSPTAYPPQTYYQPPVPAQTYPTPQPPTWQHQPQAQQGVPPQHWTPLNTIPQKRRHHSAPSLDQRAGSVDETVDSIPEQAETYEELDDDDFLGECYFASHPEDIDPNFSLGFILWKAPLPTKRALPSTWAEAELEALAPRKPLPTDDESISDYFIKEKRHEALLSVRQTGYWAEMKDDTLFKELPAVCSEIIPMSELLAKYKDRPDPAWSARPFSPPPEPEIEASSDTNGGAMDVDEQTPAARSVSRDGHSEHTDVLGNLEQALQRNGGTQDRRHSRASSTASVSSQRITRPTPLMPVRDQAQEDILAALGVTGSPKMVYQTPGPAVCAPVHQRDGSVSHSSRHNSVTSNNGGSQIPPPPPPPPGYPPNRRSPSYDSWRGNGHSNRNGYNSERRGSNTSHHTAAGSDFHSDDQDATPRPKSHRTDTRKRSHDSESDTPDERRRQDDDETPKQRRKQQRTDDPWSARR